MKTHGFIITDLDTHLLMPEERDILQHPSIAGIILFTRNYVNRKQLRELTKQIKQCRSDLFIAVDQEGGRVQRFREGFTPVPSMGEFGVLYQQDSNQAKKVLHQTIQTLSRELKTVGIDINLTPVLDIDLGVSTVIAGRSFGRDPMLVANLAQTLIDALHTEAMPAVGKHFPGHGGVVLDSHENLPVDTRTYQELEACDLIPFNRLCPSLDAVMPAHVIYAAADPKPACFSRYWLETVLRDSLRFQGVVMSDDLSMAGAASMGSYVDRSSLALEAGCNFLTICNNRKGAIEVIDGLNSHRPDEKAIERLGVFLQKVLVRTH